MNLRRTFAICFFSPFRNVRSMTAFCWVLFGLAAAELASSASAATLTVGHGRGVSYFTLSGALAASNLGDVILVQGGVYSASSGETFPLGLKSNVQLRAANPANPPTIQGNGVDRVFLIGASEGWLIEGFRITGGGGSPGGGVYCGNTSGTFRNCRIEENIVNAGEGLGVYSENSTLNFFNCTIQHNRIRLPSSRRQYGSAFVGKGTGVTFFRNCTIAHNGGRAIWCDDLHSLRIFNTLIARNDPDQYTELSDGVVFESGGDCRVTNSSIVGHRGSGIHKDSSRATVTIENSILWNYGRSIVGEGVMVKNSCVRGGYPGVGVITAYPGFVDPAGNNWRLANGSPCIDQGDSSLVPEMVAIDRDSAPRIQGAAVDLGPYESPGTYVPTAGDSPPARIHVAMGGKGGSGTSWEEAIPTLFEALLRTGPGCEVWVTGDTYPECIAAAHTLSLYGGFQGDESSPDERDPNTSRTILDASGIGSPVIQLANISGFLLDGFSLRNGFSVAGGGGINGWASTGTIRNCEILNNTGVRFGGGVYLSGSDDFLFEDTLFQGNRAPGNPYGSGLDASNGVGGAVRLSPLLGETTVFRNCRFIENSSAYRGTVIEIISTQPGTIRIEDCTFEGNFNSPRQSDLSWEYSPTGNPAVIRIPERMNLEIRNSRFLRNRIERDGHQFWLSDFGMYVLYQDRTSSPGSVVMENCEVAENINFSGVSLLQGELMNTVFRDNPGFGAEITNVQISGCRFSNNGRGGAKVYGPNGPITIRNCLFEMNGWGPYEIFRPREWVSPFTTPAGGLVLSGGPIKLLDSRIERNRGVFWPGGASINATELIMQNTIIVGNEAIGDHHATGGAYVSGWVSGSVGGPSSLEMVNCTVAGNRGTVTLEPPFIPEAIDGVYVASYSPESVKIANSIIWNGIQALSLPDESSVTHCNLSQFRAGEGNIFTDPQFLHPWDGEFADLRLPCDSPAVDAGTLEGAPTRDIEGVTRPRGSGVDMGAYENCHFDVNGDRSEDRRDVVSFTAEWHRPIDETNFGFDLHRLPPSTGRIDRLDLDQLLEAVK